MSSTLTEVFFLPLSDAFMQVGVPVALLAAFAAWARVRWGGRCLDVFVGHRRAGVLIAALLGVSPGCSGAILVVVLAARRRASYGAAVAALTATMGDASFVILAIDPAVALAIHAVLLAAGIVTGYAVDGLRIDLRSPAPHRRREVGDREVGDTEVGNTVAAAGHPRPGGSLSGPVPVPAAAFAGPVSAPPLPGEVLRATALSPSAACMWAAAAAASLLAVPASLRLVDPAALATSLDGLDLWLVLGTIGSIACLVVFLRSGCRLADDSEQGSTSMGGALTHAAVETSFVIVWVAAAFVAQAVLTRLTGFDGSQLALAGVVGVVVGATVALVPGCGTQIAFTALYATGSLPLPTLLANAVAQDGDALLPLLALDRRGAVWTSVLTTLPALVVGGAALLVL